MNFLRRTLLIVAFPPAFIAFWISLFFIRDVKIEQIIKEIGKLTP